MGRNAALCWRTGACCSGLGVGATGDAAACMPCLHAAAIEPTLISLLLIHKEYVIQENFHMLCHSIALFVVCFYASAPGMRAGTPPLCPASAAASRPAFHGHFSEFQALNMYIAYNVRQLRLLDVCSSPVTAQTSSFPLRHVRQDRRASCAPLHRCVKHQQAIYLAINHCIPVLYWDIVAVVHLCAALPRHRSRQWHLMMMTMW